MSLNMLILDATKVELLPIKAVTVYYDGEFTNFMRVEAESSYRIVPITRKTDKALNRVIGFTVELTIYIPHVPYIKYGATTDFDTEDVDASDFLINRLNKLAAEKEGVDTHLLLGSGGFNPGGTPSGIVKNFTHGKTLDFGQLGFNYEIESVELRPRTILHFNGVARSIGMSSTQIVFA